MDTNIKLSKLNSWQAFSAQKLVAVTAFSLVGIIHFKLLNTQFYQNRLLSFLGYTSLTS